IVATQVLESMVNNSVPTRAEISDITNAIIDNADALMLSEESAIGKFPVAAVRTLRDVSDYVENLVSFNVSDSFLGNKIAFSVARAAKILADDIKADGIVALTHTGSTVRMLSSLRPDSMIYAATVSRSLARRLNIYFGVMPLKIRVDAESLNFEQISDYLKDSGFFKKGDKIVLTSGDPYFVFGGTNDVRMMVIGDFLARGYPSGKSIEGIATYGKNGDIMISSDSNVEDYHYPAYVFTCSVKPEILKKLEGKTVIVRTRIAKKIEEGEKIFIDGNTGIIVRSN
ncbi:MAG: pyruvate kinase, partial [Thermoplasmata archaeon]